jgi:hypothetical protein
MISRVYVCQKGSENDSGAGPNFRRKETAKIAREQQENTTRHSKCNSVKEAP